MASAHSRRVSGFGDETHDEGWTKLHLPLLAGLTGFGLHEIGACELRVSSFSTVLGPLWHGEVPTSRRLACVLTACTVVWYCTNSECPA